MSEPSATTSNAEIARNTTCPAGGGGMAASAASQLLDDGSGIACVAAPCIRHHPAATNIIVFTVRNT